MPGSHSTPGRGPVPIVQEAGWAPGPVWTGEEISPPAGFFYSKSKFTQIPFLLYSLYSLYSEHIPTLVCNPWITLLRTEALNYEFSSGISVLN
jgi:hypothetical protein